MLRNIFLKTLRDRFRGLVFWGVGLLFLSFYLIAFYPVIAGSPELSSFLDNLPPAARSLLGDIPDMLSPAGYFQAEMFTLSGPILFLIYTILFGSDTIAGEEQRGTLELLLANPVSRTRTVLEKLGALVVATGILALVLWDGLALGSALYDIDLSPGKLAGATLALFLLAVSFGALALALGCWTGRKSLAAGTAGVVAVASYFLNTTASFNESLAPYRKLSLFYHYGGNDPLRNGLDWGGAGLLLGVTLILALIAVLGLNRRDIGVN